MTAAPTRSAPANDCHAAGIGQQRMVRAHWEHGYRCHGYWCDTTGKRIGMVGIGPRNLWDGIYRVHMDGWPHTRPSEEHKTLKAAKRAVERYASRPNDPSSATAENNP